MRRLLALTATATLTLTACSFGDTATNTGQDQLPIDPLPTTAPAPSSSAPTTSAPADEPTTEPAPVPSTPTSTTPAPSPSTTTSGPTTTTPSSTMPPTTSATSKPSAKPTPQAPITGWGDVRDGAVTSAAQADALPIGADAKAWVKQRATSGDERCSGSGVTVKQYGADGWITMSPNGSCGGGTPTDVYKKIGGTWQIYYSFGRKRVACSDTSWQSLPQQIKSKWPCS